RGRDDDGVLEGQPAVERAARNGADAADGRVDREPGDDPDVVLRVVGDGRVADPGVWAGRARVDRGARQEAVRPGSAAVRRGGVAEVRRAAAAEATDLEGCDHRRAEGIRIGLDLGLVLARRVRIRIDAEPDKAEVRARARDRRRDERGTGYCDDELEAHRKCSLMPADEMQAASA